MSAVLKLSDDLEREAKARVLAFTPEDQADSDARREIAGRLREAAEKDAADLERVTLRLDAIANMLKRRRPDHSARCCCPHCDALRILEADE